MNIARQEAIKHGNKTYTSNKACPKCDTSEKYVSSYSCVECTIRQSRHKLDDPVLMSKYRTKEKNDAKQKTWRDKNPEQFRNQWLRHACRRFGITTEQYQEMLDAQNGVCKICQNECTRGRLSIDHDHATGKIRGLLCRKCNLGLGDFRDNTQYLSRAMEYLNGKDSGNI